MKPTLILAALAAAIAAVPAQAQPVAADLLPAYEVATIIASMGMRPVGRPAWSRGRYVVAAVDRYGREVNVVLDARDGQVLAVRPLGRNSFGPPPGYAGRPAPYDPMDGRAPPPAAGPGAPPPAEDDEFFDNDRQQGSLPPPRPNVRTAPPQRDPAITGSVTRSVPAERGDIAAAPRKDAAPVPRPRPALAKTGDPGNRPASAPADQTAPAAAKPGETKPAAASKPAQAEAKAEVRPEAGKPEAGKPEIGKTEIGKPQANKPQTNKPENKQAQAPQTGKPGQAKPEVASKPEAPKPDVRVIDLSKPKTTAKPEEKPGEAIRF